MAELWALRRSRRRRHRWRCHYNCELPCCHSGHSDVGYDSQIVTSGGGVTRQTAKEGVGRRLGSGAIDHGLEMWCTARKSEMPALESSGWAGGAWVHCIFLRVCGDNSEVQKASTPKLDSSHVDPMEITHG